MSSDCAPISVVLASDSMLIGDGLESLLAGVGEVALMARVSAPQELLASVREHRPDVLVISTLTTSGAAVGLIRAAQKLRAETPDLGIVVILDGDRGMALQLLGTGTAGTGFLMADRLAGVDSLMQVLREVRVGHSVLDASVVDALVRGHEGITIAHLTARELDVLAQIAHGLSNRAVASALRISPKAVENHVTAIFRKLGLSDRPGLDRRVTAVLAFQRAQAALHASADADPPVAPDPTGAPSQRGKPPQADAEAEV